MIIAGIDFSLNCPGICVYSDVDPFDFNHCRFLVYQKDPKKSFGKNNKCGNILFDIQDSSNSKAQRIHKLACRIFDFCRNADIFVIEGYSMHAIGRVFDIAEATGILKEVIYGNCLAKIYTCPPTVSKKTLTRKGNANKSLMISEFNRLNNIDIATQMGYNAEYDGSPVSDLVDSFALVHAFLNADKTLLEVYYG